MAPLFEPLQSPQPYRRLTYFVTTSTSAAHQTFYALLADTFSKLTAGKLSRLTLDTSMLYGTSSAWSMCLIWEDDPLDSWYCSERKQCRSWGVWAVSTGVAYSYCRQRTALWRAGRPVWTWRVDALVAQSSLVGVDEFGWKCDLQSDPLSTGMNRDVEQLLPSGKPIYSPTSMILLPQLQQRCQLQERRARAVLSDEAPLVADLCTLRQSTSVGLNPTKDYRSLLCLWHVRSHLRDGRHWRVCLARQYLIALVLGMLLVQLGQQEWIRWHSQQGLSFLQLGLRLQRFVLSRATVASVEALPRGNPPCCLCFSAQTWPVGLPNRVQGLILILSLN